MILTDKKRVKGMSNTWEHGEGMSGLDRLNVYAVYGSMAEVRIRKYQLGEMVISKVFLQQAL